MHKTEYLNGKQIERMLLKRNERAISEGRATRYGVARSLYRVETLGRLVRLVECTTGLVAKVSSTAEECKAYAVRMGLQLEEVACA